MWRRTGWAAGTLTVRRGPSTPRSSKIELVDVRLRELQRRPENDLAAANLDPAEAPAVHGRGAAREGPPRELRAGVDGEIAEVGGVPEHDRLYHAGVHIVLVQVGQ